MSSPLQAPPGGRPHAAGHGHDPRGTPRQGAARAGRRCAAGGRARPRRTRSRRSAIPSGVAIVDERGTLTFAEVNARTNALARALRGGGRRRTGRGRDHVPQPPRVHRGDRGVREARGERAVPEHGVRGPADRRRAAPRGAEGADLRRGVRRASCSDGASGCGASSSWSEPERGAGAGPAGGGADRAARTARRCSRPRRKAAW